MLPSPAPIVAVEHEAAIGLDRSPHVQRHVGRLARIDVELPHQPVQADIGKVGADADAERAAFVVAAHRDHRTLESRVADPGHGEQQLASEKRGAFHAVT